MTDITEWWQGRGVMHVRNSRNTMDSEMQAVTRRNIVVVAGYLDVYMGIDRAGLSDVHEEYGLANGMVYKYWMVQRHSKGE